MFSQATLAEKTYGFPTHTYKRELYNDTLMYGAKSCMLSTSIIDVHKSVCSKEQSSVLLSSW